MTYMFKYIMHIIYSVYNTYIYIAAQSKGLFENVSLIGVLEKVSLIGFLKKVSLVGLFNRSL